MMQKQKEKLKADKKIYIILYNFDFIFSSFLRNLTFMKSDQIRLMITQIHSFP